jgi:hypothetical protein
MKNKNRVLTLGLLAMILFVGATVPGMGQVKGTAPVWTDAFDYSDWTTGAKPMNGNWSLTSGSEPRINSSGGASFSSRIDLDRGVIGTNLNWPLSVDFQLTVDALPAPTSKLIWVGLFNAAGTQGYGFSWSAGNATDKGSHGVVSIRKYEVADPAKDLATDTTGALLGSEVDPGHAATPSDSPAHIKLTWTGDTQTLELSVDGKVVSTVKDASFASFARIYLSGESGSLANVAVAVPGGATVPFTTYEAEDPHNTTTGKVVRLTRLPAKDETSAEIEASGRGYVELSETGQYLEITSTEAANTVVIRHCIPDAEKGGGITATLSLYVNGEKRQALSVSSLHNWNYFGAKPPGDANDPANGTPKIFWDESRYFITGGLKAGDKIRFQKDADDSAAYYRIDCIDLENVAGPLEPPAEGTYLSVKDYGAVGNGVADDTSAIARCIADAKDRHKIVWLPEGSYRQTERFVLEGVKVQGAGMWYTNLLGTVEGTAPTDWPGKIGFTLGGNGTEVRDLFIDDVNNTKRQKGGKPFLTKIKDEPTNWKVENVWITHTVTGFWMTGATDGVIRKCRIRCTYADAININGGSSNCLVEQNHIRGVGDDGTAILSEIQRPVSTNITIQFNTVIANWAGHNCDLAGGSGHIIRYNYWADNNLEGCFTINLPGSYPMNPVAGATISRNIIVRGGGNQGNQRRGAIWIFPGSTPISNVVIQDNYILDPIFRGIHLTGTFNQQITFERNIIDHPGEDGVVIDGKVTGSSVFNNNLVLHVKNGFVPYKNNAGVDYTVTGTGNSWP